MLTTPERQRLTTVLSNMKPEARVAHIAWLRQTPGKAAEVAVLEGIHQQLCFAEKAAATPFEVVGNVGPSKAAQRDVQVPQEPPYWTPERTKHAALAVVAVGGLSALVALVVIPAVVVAVRVLAELAALVLPWIVGGIFLLIVLKSALFGEKKTGQSPAESHRQPSGNVYNIYIGENQNVRINP